ncbi:MAG TPA: hypothetical protein VKR29_07740 [Candidatus Binataceae bacterium]|nr:hypothetical protein [Candidatus Binataceae bacterium]
MRIRMRLILLALMLCGGGCYYAARIQPPKAAETRATVTRPYDLTWDAVHTVVKQNDFRIVADDPNQGIVEVESHAFTTGDADCGQMKSVGNRFDAQPDPGGSAVYEFKVEPNGPESTNLSVNATYSTPLHVPFHPITNFQCISRGTQEARLLHQIDATAQAEQRPTKEVLTPRPVLSTRPSLLDSDILKRPQPSP